MIERLVPRGVATAETREDILEIELFEEEQRSMGRAVEKRRREFVTGRACARDALRRLGVSVVAITNGPHGEPLWPTGVVGSITHCRGYRACAVARIEKVTSLGIDAEENAPLPEGVLEQVAFGPELDLVTPTGGVQMDRLLFSAKEAIYKAWFPLAQRWLGFEDVNLELDAATRTFRARLHVPGPMIDGRRLTEFSGRWCVEDGVIGTSVVIPATGMSDTAWPH
jgi:4'-phosphopantetheinyl transferase EntD